MFLLTTVILILHFKVNAGFMLRLKDAMIIILIGEEALISKKEQKISAPAAMGSIILLMFMSAV